MKIAYTIPYIFNIYNYNVNIILCTSIPVQYLTDIFLYVIYSGKIILQGIIPHQRETFNIGLLAIWSTYTNSKVNNQNLTQLDVTIKVIGFNLTLGSQNLI